MSYDVFISYSHKDESYLSSLVSHLATLRNEGKIKDWYDREIDAGSEWDAEIRDNLEKAQLILLLISPDFLSSPYCQGVEMQLALERHNANECIVVPVSIRSCDWGESEFAKIQAVPKDAHPVSAYEDQDVAFTEIVKSIRSLLVAKNIELQEHKRANFNFGPHETEATQDFWSFLRDPGLELSHPRQALLELKDIYVYPDCKLLDDSGDHQLIRSLESLPENGEQLKVVFGSEQGGLTSFAKMVIAKKISELKKVLYIDFGKVTNRNIQKALREACEWHYGHKDISGFPVVLLDDYEKTNLNLSAKKAILDELSRVSSEIFVLSRDTILYSPDELEVFEGFSHYEVQPFGHKKREELIARWVRLGRSDTITEHQVHQEVDVFGIHIDSFVRKNVVPSKPLFLVSILQGMETMTPTKLHLTSYGHCYQHLIYQALTKAKVQPHYIDSYLNFLTEFAYHVFCNGGGYLSTGEVTRFCSKYHEEYIGVECDEAIRKLTSCGILDYEKGGLGFRYKYIYYFFAGKYLADHISDDDVRRDIQELLEHIDKEDSANIAIFTTHHTKDRFVLDEIQMTLLSQFDEMSEASLSVDQLGFMRDFMERIPRLVLEQRDVEEERKRRNEALDELENDKSEVEDESPDSPDDLLRRINKTVRGIEIIGQIARNRHGSLPRKEIKTVVDSAIGSGLQFLQYFIEMSDHAKEDVVESIKNQIRDEPGINDEKLAKEAREIFLLMTYGAIYGLLRKMANSLGCREVLPVFLELEKERSTPAAAILELNVELTFAHNLDIDRLKEVYHKLEGNGVCQRMFRESLLMYIYLHDVKYDIRSKISSHFDIPERVQQKVSARRETKVLPRR